MSLINFLFFFFLLNYSLVQSIRMNTTCEYDRYYDSLNYECTQCINGVKGINVCYSNTERISIYTFNKIDENIKCDNEKVLTELDGNRRLLTEPVCANKTFNYTDINNSYISHGTTSDSADISLPSTYNGRNEYIYKYEENEFNYYNKSCIDGKNERACDYLANLCSLSLYNDRSNNDKIPCEAIKILDTLLHNNHIL